MKLLIMSDTHIPERALKIPSEIEKFLKDVDIVVHAGDLTGEDVLSYLMSFNLIVVKGNMDFLKLPRYEVFKSEKLNFGVFHGHGIYPRGDRKQLTDVALDLGVDVLITGHTHRSDVYRGDVLILNPGSATGAWGGGGGSGVPSFMILKVEEREVTVYLYEIRENLDVKTFKFEI